MNFHGYTEDEIKRWLWLRAIEWGAFPAYLSQPVAPILFIFYHWYFVVLGVVALGLIWCFFRYSFVSVGLSSAVVLPVVWLKWPAAVGSSIYLFVHHQHAAGVVALLWPLVHLLVCPDRLGSLSWRWPRRSDLYRRMRSCEIVFDQMSKAHS